MRHWLFLWKRAFDYKGVSSRAEYRLPLLVTAVLAALTIGFWSIGSMVGGEPLMIAGLAAGVLFTLHVPPMMALTVRRLRDAGRRPWLAALSCLAGVGTVAVMLICLLSVSSTGYLPLHNINQNVYGPPPEYYDPQNNINEDIYGPPEMFFGEENTATEELLPEEALTGDEN